MLKKRDFEEVKIGERVKFSKTISETDVILFAGICGDFNPLHVDEEFAKASLFKERVAHGILSGSLISTTVAEILGAGGVYLSQSFRFVAPVKLGDTITAVSEVVEKLEKNRIRIKTKCVNQNGKTVIDGEALGLIPRKK